MVDRGTKENFVRDSHPDIFVAHPSEMVITFVDRGNYERAIVVLSAIMEPFVETD